MFCLAATSTTSRSPSSCYDRSCNTRQSRSTKASPKARSAHSSSEAKCKDEAFQLAALSTS
eukprot:UN4355